MVKLDINYDSHVFGENFASFAQKSNSCLETLTPHSLQSIYKMNLSNNAVGTEKEGLSYQR